MVPSLLEGNAINPNPNPNPVEVLTFSGFYTPLLKLR